RRNTALMGYVGGFGKVDRDEDAALFETAQLVGELARRVVLVEVIAGFLQALDAFRRGNAAGRDNNVVVTDALAGLGLDARALEVECGHLGEGDVDFRAQRRAMPAAKRVLERRVEGDIHERRLVVVPG